MIKQGKSSINSPFILLMIAVFLALTLPSLFQKGLFMDGMIYAVLSQNMANGIGTFWEPSFLPSFMSEFHEHPPLVFGIQSFFFKIFGDGFITEKLYSFLTAILTAIYIHKIWKKLSPDKSTSQLWWFPIICWIIMPICFWSYNNNMLENTMGLFSIMAIYYLLKSTFYTTKEALIYILMASILLLLSFLSKGFPGLYPLAFFGGYWFFFKSNYSFKRCLLDSTILIIGLASISFVLLSINHNAYNSLNAYINSQVLESLNGQRVVVSRWLIFQVLLQNLIIILPIVLLLYFGYYKKAWRSSFKQQTNKSSLLLLVIGFTASAPIMVSPKQLSFYCIPAIPFFIMAICFVGAVPLACDRFKH